MSQESVVVIDASERFSSPSASGQFEDQRGEDEEEEETEEEETEEEEQEEEGEDEGNPKYDFKYSKLPNLTKKKEYTTLQKRI